MSELNLIQRMRLLEVDHQPDSFPPVQMQDVTGLLDELQGVTETAMSLFKLVADIRKAAGDETGKLMQDELVEHIKRLKDENRKLNDYIANAGLDPLTNHMEQNK